MSEPIVFISKHRIKNGKFDGFQQFFRQGVEKIREDLPGTVAQLAYASEDSREVRIIHIFPDGDAMARHIQGAGQRAEKSYEFLEPLSYEVFGSPTGDILERMKQISGSGVSLSVMPRTLGGFMRLGSS